MLRKLPQGEWDCDFEELQGASHVEDYDSGELNSRAGQAMSEFKGLAGKASLSKFEQEKAAAAAESDSEHDSRPPSQVGSSEDLGSNNDSDVDILGVGLAWVITRLALFGDYAVCLIKRELRNCIGFSWRNKFAS